MNIIDPIPFVAENITTNIPITETQWTAGNYDTGVRRYVLPSYDLYEVVAHPNTDDEPTVGAAKEIKTWAKVGKVNAYNCFDGVLSNSTVFTDGFDMTISGGNAFKTGIAIFEVFSTDIRITVYDESENEVYDRTISLIDDSAIKDLWDYHTAPIKARPIAFDIGLPPYVNSSIRIRCSGEGRIGEVAVGYATNLGKATWGGGSQIDDFSTAEFDTFGQPIIIERGYAVSLEVNGIVPTGSLAWVQRELARRRATPTVFIGSTKYESTIAYGLFRDIATAMAGPSISAVSIKVRGIV